jgi:hypothetical protein
MISWGPKECPHCSTWSSNDFIPFALNCMSGLPNPGPHSALAPSWTCTVSTALELAVKQVIKLIHHICLQLHDLFNTQQPYGLQHSLEKHLHPISFTLHGLYGSIQEFIQTLNLQAVVHQPWEMYKWHLLQKKYHATTKTIGNNRNMTSTATKIDFNHEYNRST